VLRSAAAQLPLDPICPHLLNRANHVFRKSLDFLRLANSLLSGDNLLTYLSLDPRHHHAYSLRKPSVGQVKKVSNALLSASPRASPTIGAWAFISPLFDPLRIPWPSSAIRPRNSLCSWPQPPTGHRRHQRARQKRGSRRQSSDCPVLF